MVDDLHRIARVDPSQIGQELEPEGRLVVQGPQDVGHVPGFDPDLGLVVTLAHGPGEDDPEPLLEAVTDRSIHVLRRSRARWDPRHAPASGRAGP